MKTASSNHLHHLDSRLTAYAAAGLALTATTATLSKARAAIVYSGPLSLVVPQNSGGIYLNLVTRATSTSTFGGYDINFLASSSSNALTFFRPPTTALVSTVSTSAPASALPFGTSIGPTSTFTTSGAGTNFQVAGTEYLGIKFTNEPASFSINYGWIQLTTGSTTGFPATIIGYAFDNTGAALTAGQTAAVPEPATTVVLGLGALALGASGVRRWRRGKSITA